MREAHNGGKYYDESGRIMEHAGVLLQKEPQKRKNIKMHPQNKNHLCSNGAGIRAGLPLHSDYSGMGIVMVQPVVCGICV